MTKQLKFLLITLLGLGCIALLTQPAQAGADEDLTLRLEDTDARVNGTAVFVIRTYSPRPVGSGQMCFRLRRRARRSAVNPSAGGASNTATRGGEAPIIASIDKVVAFSPSGDAIIDGELVEGVDGQDIVLDFSSASAGINSVDGPMIAVVAQLGSGALAGDEFEIALDAAQTSITDEHGATIPLRLREGRLTVLGAAEPVDLGLELQSLTGEQAQLSVDTRESLALTSGVLRIDFPAGTLADAPQVSAPPQQGAANITVTQPDPNSYRIELSVLSDSPLLFGELPGDLLIVDLPLAEGPTTNVALTFHPGGTTLLAVGGAELSLDLEQGVNFTAGGDLLFSDGFEVTADTSAWHKRSQALLAERP